MSDLRRLLPQLASEDWRRAEEAVETLGDLLASLSDKDATRVAKKLAALVRHPKWEVRRAVARTMLNSRDPSFEGVLAELVRDENSWVRDAARRTLARRTELATSDVLKEQHEDFLARWLAVFGERYGSRAREEARKVANKYSELLVREAYHELVKAISPLDLALTNLETALEEERIKREGCRKHVTRARQRLRLLNAMLKSLRDLTTEVTPEFAEEDLRSVISEAVAIVREERRRKIRCEIVVAKGLVVELHRVRALQAFTNILKNGVDSYDGLDRSPWLRVEAVVTGPRVVLSFTDRGCGMNEEALQDVFNLFASKKPEGLGFGLALTRRILTTEHRGSVRLSSRPGAGTTVTVTLPIEQEPS